MKLALAQTIRKRIVVEDIEPRILYSADALAVSQLLVDDTTANNQLVLVLDAENQQSNNATQQPPVSNSSQSETTQTQNSASADNQNATTVASAEVDSAQQQTRKEIVFVDTRVADYQQLVDDILAKATQGQSVEVVMIRDNEDGLQTILDTLKARGQVDAIHLLGEGANAQLILGNRLLTAEQLAAQSDLFKEIGQHLTADADILIYGCNFAQDATGQAMVQTLADLTGADVAASNDRTGHANENGDWVLEYYSGKVESDVPLSLATQASWEHSLATFTVTSNADFAGAELVSGTLRYAITQANLVGGTDNIVFNLSSGNETIRLVSALPTISSQIHFSVTNGTQAIISGDTNNNGVADINSGLVFNATGGSSSITGLTIRDFVADGIRLNNAQSITVTNSVISHNNVGIRIAGDSRLGVYTSNTISNNAVGISIDEGYVNRIGGITPSLGNVITNNTLSGVRMTGGGMSWYNTVIGNQIYGNGGLGIDLNADNAVLLNDANDSDNTAIANQGQNYPLISAVTYNSTTQELTITGHLDSYTGGYFRLEFFGLEAANVDANGYGEGQLLLGSYLFYNNTAGYFSTTLTGVSLANIQAITATATYTNSNQSTFYDTSEFSAQYNTNLLINVTNPTVVNTNTTGYQSPPLLQTLNDGRVLYVWVNDALSDNSTNMTLQGRIMNADGTASTNQFQIGTWAADGNNNYDLPNVTLAKLNNGNVVVGWVRNTSSPGGDEPVFSIIDTTLAPSNPSFFVVTQAEIQTTDTTTTEGPPILTALADGRFMATWLKNGLDEDVNYNNLYSRIFNANGTPATGEFQVGTFGVDNFDNFDLPSITVKQLTGGNVVIGFVRSTGFGNDTPLFHVINPSLLPGAPGFVVASDVVVIQNDVTTFESPPVIQTLSDGRFIAAWVRNGADGSSSTATVWARIFNANGTAATNDFQVGTLPAAGWDLLDNDKVSIAELDNGKVVIALAKDNSVTDGRIDPYFSIIDTTKTPGTAGFSVVSDVRVNNQISPSGTYVGAPVVVAMPGNTGNFVVAWSDSYSDGILKVRLYSSAGVALTNEIRVSDSANSLVSGLDSFDVNTIQIATLNNNSIVLGWAGVGDGSLTGAFTSTVQFNVPPVAVNDVANMTETRVPTVYYVDANGDFGTYNAATGAKTLIGNAGIVMLDIAVDKSGLIYATDENLLYRINPNNATLTLVGATNSAINALGFDDAGNLYGVGGSTLYTVNTTTGAATVLANFSAMSNNQSSGDIVFANNKLYFSTNSFVGTNAVLSYDLSTGLVTQFTTLPAAIWGLAVNGDGTTLSALADNGNRYQINLSTSNVTLQGTYASPTTYGLAAKPSIQISTGDVTPGTGGQDYDPNAGDSISVTGVMSGSGTPSSGVGSPINGTYGQLVLNADGTYSYALDSSRPATIAIGGNQVVQEVFSYRITDTSGSHAYATLTINVTGFNDAPSGSNATLTITEDAPYIFTTANFGFTDVDSNTFTAVRISTLPALGALTLNGVAVTAGQSITVADINAGLLVFTPVADGNGTNYSNFTFQVQDNGGTANGGMDLDATPNTITFNVTAVNDAPTISSLGPQFTTINSSLYFNTTNGNRILIGDVDASTSSLTVTLSVTQGTFTLASVSGLTFTTGDGTTDTSMVFSGNLTNINAALDNAFFTPNNGYTGGASLSVSVNDLGNQGAGGALIASQNLAIQVNSVSYNPITIGPNLVNQNTTFNQSAATPLKLDDGRILYVWIDNALADDVTNMTVQGRIFNADGTASTNQFQIGTWAVDGSDDFDLENLSLAKLSNGNVVIGWVRSFASGNDEPVMAIINPTLAPTNPSFVVLGQTEIQQNDTTNIESPPIIKALADGKFIAVWSKNALNDGEPANKVMARIFNADGSAFTGDIQIGTWAVDGFNGYDNDNITVTQLTGGNIIVAYVRATGEVGADEPVFTVISSNGTTVVADVEMQQNDTTTFESPPVITALSDGRFMAVWVKNGVDDNGLSLTMQGRIFNADGTPATNEFQVGNSPADGWDEYDTDNVVMTQLDNGNVVVGFVRNTDVANNDWPFFTIINPNITPGQAGFTVAADVQINTTTTQSIGPPVIVSLPGSGGLFAVVRADINANSPIYARLYNGSGQPLTNEVLITSNANNQLSSNNGFDVSNLKMIALDQNSVVISWVGVNDGDGTGAYTSILHFNIRPVALNSNVGTVEDVPFVFSATHFNFSDADGDALASIRITSLENAGRLLLNGVDVTLNQVISRANINAGLLTFVPASNANGVGYANFGYSVNDGLQDSVSTYTMTINVTPVADLVANNDSATGAEDSVINGNASLNDSTTSGGVLTYAVATVPSNGNLTFNADGTYSYQGNADYNGLDSFTYTVTDAASGESLTRTVNLTVTQVNDAGTFAGNLSGTGNEDTPITGTVNFTDSRDGYTTPNFALQTNGANGVASINGIGQWTYTPNANFNGVDSFTILTTDDDGNVETQVITVTVNAVADLVANNDSASGAEDTAINGNVSLNDSTTSGGVLSFTLATGPSNGSLTFNTDGTYSYQGNADYNGLDSFTYTVTDAASGESLTRTVNLTVTQVNDAGTFSGNLSGIGNEDAPITGTVNFTDSRDGYTTPNFALQTNGANGVASINGMGQWTYTPNANFNGVDSFTILTTDDDGNVETQIITINVQAVNDAPTSSGTNVIFSEDFNFVSALPAAFDLDGDAVTYSLFTQPSHGSVVVNSNGSFSFSPTLNYNGTDQFSFMVSDGNGGASVYLVTVTIDPVNDLPTTSAVTLSSMAEDTSRIITQAELLANANDVDGDTLQVTSLQIASGNGSLSNNGNGSWTYTSAQNDDSSVTFSFTITDGQATTNGFSTLDITAVDEVILPPDGGGGSGGGGSGGGGSGGGGSGGGSGSSEDKTQSKEDTSSQLLLNDLLDNNQSGKNSDGNGLASKENGEPVFELSDKIKKTVNEQNSAFSTPVYKVNEANDISLVSAKLLGALSYGQGSNEGENSLVGGLKYDQKIAFAMNTLEEQLNLKEFKVNFDTGAQVSTVVFSAGLMAWATQYTGLFASLFASLPAWSALDPMPILNKVNDDEDEFDEDDANNFEDDDYDVNRVLS